MNIQLHRNNFLRHAPIIVLLLAGIFLVPAARAQPTEETVQSRFLFIFETSEDMRSRAEAMKKSLNIMLATSMNGQLHAGDSMGVWTFSQDLRPGDFPLQSWDPGDAVMIASNMTKFIGGRHYAKSGRFTALQPLLNRVVESSERLTVIIFCDGETPVSGTPFDAGINQTFQEKLGKQKSARQPFVIGLRAQLGQYVNCSMGFPPQPMTFSAFPPLPEPPPQPAPKPANVPPPVTGPIVPSLIIVGTKVESSPSLPGMGLTNLPPTTNESPTTEPPAPPVVPVQPTNTPAVSSSQQLLTNPIAQTVASTNSTRLTNAPVALAKISSSSNKNFLIAGAGLLGAVIALMIVLLWRRSNRKDSSPSLITRSMDDRK